MKIGILGTGDVAVALARGFLGLGHQVMLGSREAGGDKLAGALGKLDGKATGGTFADAARSADLVVLATLGVANEAVIAAAGPDNLAGKVLIDATNPLDFSAGFPPRLLAPDGSGGQQVQRLAPGARVVKAFNTVGNSSMVNPKHAGGPPTMFLCGDDDAAKKTVAEICASFGWDVSDIGGIANAHYLEAMCMVWVLHAARTGAWGHAFKLLPG